MCTVLIWFHPESENPLCVAFNRDERYDRRGDVPRIVHGKGAVALHPIDPRSGGTWFGINSHGITACVLNDVQRARPASGSRGPWMSELLGQATSVEDAHVKIETTWSEDFQPSYLVIATIERVRVYRPGTTPFYVELHGGFHTVCDSSGLEDCRRSVWQRERLGHGKPPEFFEDIHGAMAEHVSCKTVFYTTCCHARHSGTVSSQFVRWRRNGQLSTFYHLGGAHCGEGRGDEFVNAWQTQSIRERRS